MLAGARVAGANAAMPADEFEIIASHFAPLVNHDGARGLLDDAAVITARADLVMTMDSIVEGVHFLADDPIDTVAKKALRVNLSDLAAKGAKPIGVLVSLVWPTSRDAEQIGDFARGLGEDLKLFDVALLGGDTTSTPGPLVISVTAFGEQTGQRTPSRAGAAPGDDVWVTGRIGDAHLGLLALTAPLAREESAPHLVARYRMPEPRLPIAALVGRLASASIDISDGFLQDAAKIASASGVALKLDLNAVPLSPDAKAWIEEGGTREALLSAGDDYEILFTAPGAVHAEIDAMMGVTRIGAVARGQGLADLDGAQIAAAGYRHKLGR